MARKQGNRGVEIDEYIDQNLKRVFAEFESDEMPDRIVDLLSVLKAQDQEDQKKG